MSTLLGMALLLAGRVCAEDVSRSGQEVLRVGHWVEVRGSMSESGAMIASRILLAQPERYESLTGTPRSTADGQWVELLGQAIELNEKTTWTGVDSASLVGARVKIEGYYEGNGNFSSRKVYARRPGQDGLVGRIDAIRSSRAGLELTIMETKVRLPEDRKVQHLGPLEQYPLSPPRVLSIVDRDRDEEDLLGKGIWLNDRLLLAGQLQLVGLLEDDFDLKGDRAKKRDDLETRFRARVVYQPSSSLFAVASIVHRRRYRDDQRSGRLEDDETRLGETYLYFLDPWRNGFSLQVGRVDFDERREWLYDQDLDTVRAIWERGSFRLEASYSEFLFDASVLDEASRNTMVYLSNNDSKRHLAGYVIHRDFQLPIPIKRTNYGLRAFGEWLPDNDSWLELAWMDGSTGPVKQGGWAVDLGTTWEFHDRFALTLGYALGQGDDPESRADETFRQTGLQDNNDRFAGVTSLKYYGELVDPELANMKITTIGLGWLPRKRVSLDLVWHRYQQHELSRRLIDTQLGKRPNGSSRQLGQELDLVLGLRTSKTWNLEAIAAWFEPGDAFDEADTAFLAKLQFRYRF
jgi:alginate production protein